MTLDEWLATVEGLGAILTHQEGDMIVYHVAGRKDLVYARPVVSLYASLANRSVDAKATSPSAEPQPAGGAELTTSGSTAEAPRQAPPASRPQLVSSTLLVVVLLVAGLVLVVKGK